MGDQTTVAQMILNKERRADCQRRYSQYQLARCVKAIHFHQLRSLHLIKGPLETGHPDDAIGCTNATDQP